MVDTLKGLTQLIAMSVAEKFERMFIFINLSSYLAQRLLFYKS